LSPLSEVKLKSDFGAVRAAFDPKRTSTLLGARFRLEGYDNSRVRLLPRQRGQCK
jgi:hypothetical protein